MIIKYCGTTDKFMKAAYQIAKGYYAVNGWNKKTTPVCILVKGKKIISIGVSGNGMHPILAHCDRENHPGSPYSHCKYCSNDQHAEIRAISELKTDAYGAVAYLYGHHHLCSNCESELVKIGVRTVFFLQKSDKLFDRHHLKTVIGWKKQFDK